MKHKIALIYSKVLHKKIEDVNFADDKIIIYAYRYLSWALTSFAYLTGIPYSAIVFKASVIISLLICSIIVNDLYIKNIENKRVLQILVLIETLGLALLLLPTGGLTSPFIWYALNSTLIAASYLPAYFCWINLLFYLICGTSVSYFLFNTENINIISLFLNNSNITLVFILITLAVQLLARLAQKLNNQASILEEQKIKIMEINEVLTASNNQKQEAIEQIMTFYHIIEAMNNHSNKEKLFEVFAEYTAKLTKSNTCIFWLPDINEDNTILKTNKALNESELKGIISELKKIYFSEDKANETRIIHFMESQYCVKPILSPTSYYGLIALNNNNLTNDDEKKQRMSLLDFISGLCTVTLERFVLEDIEDNMLIIEEQNRIANEIHDSVSQRLFSLTYAIHGILGRWDEIKKEELKDYLIEINESAKCTMKELRNSIYRLSSKKRGENSLKIGLQNFIDSISKLNGVEVNFEVNGDEGLLPFEMKNSITRIIREACGNAIRHGKCSHISLDLEISPEQVRLSVADDGTGFSIKKVYLENQNGLGLSNMKKLVNYHKGSIKIDSNPGAGTEIYIMMPLSFENNRKVV